MLKGIDPGKLDRRITLQSRTTAANAYNEPIETWATLATVWASIDYPLTGSGETFQDAINQAATNITFTIRHRDDVGFVERISYNGDTYDIERISETGRNDHLQIQAKRRL
jgi:SPP1 family predicted phage head-tail adaptor